MPFAALQHDAGGHHKQGYHTGKIYHIATVNHTTANRLVVVAHTQRTYKQVSIAQEAHAEYRLKSQMHKGTHQGSKNESDNLVVGDWAGKQTNGNKGCTQQEHAYVRTDHTARVDIAHGVAQRHHAEIAHQGRQQGDEH